MNPVAYVYNQQITKYIFSEDHPMKPKRIKMAHSLIENYQLTREMRIFHGKSSTREQICQFHHPDYVDYLRNWVSPNTKAVLSNMPQIHHTAPIAENSRYNEIFKINKSVDCPSFEGLFDFCELAVGSSLDAADLIITGEAQIAVNWAGGYHHAKKSEASGFCYVNDIVVCILQLLKAYPRVLYIDIDVHHGDGVEEAFYHTNRVLTLSFHQYEEDFFPGTGEVESVGQGQGKYFSVNVPFRRGIDDMSYIEMFKKVTNVIVSSYRPDVIVLQSGADSLSKDRIGNFQLSIAAYGQCIRHVKQFGVPIVMLGGGGYTIENVARCWAYETGVILGREIEDKIPECDQFFSYYKDDGYKIHFEPQMLNKNMNQRKDLDNMVKIISQNMKEAEIRPSIAFHYTPKNFVPGYEMDWRMANQDSDSMTDDAAQGGFFN